MGKTPTSIQNHYDVTMAPRTKWRGSHHNTWPYKGISTGRHYPWKHSALYLTPDVYKTKTEDRRPKTEDPKPKIQNRRPSCQMPRDKTQKGQGFCFVVYPLVCQIERLQKKPWGSFLTLFKGLKSLKSDQHQFSSLKIITKSNGKVIRFNKMITYKKKLKSFIKFAHWFFKTTYWVISLAKKGEERKRTSQGCCVTFKSFCLSDRDRLGNRGRPIWLKFGTLSYYGDLCNMPKFQFNFSYLGWVLDVTLFGVPNAFFIAHFGHFSILWLQCQGDFKPNINSLFIISILKVFIAKHIHQRNISGFLWNNC